MADVASLRARARRVLRHHGVTLVLTAAALVLTVVVLWDRGNVTTSEAEDRRYQLIDAWRPDDIERLTIELGDRTLRLEAERSPEGNRHWKLFEDDRELDVDEQSVGQFLVSLEFAGFERRIEGIDRTELGLNEPRMAIALDMGELRYALRLGREAPSPPGAIYAEVEGGARGTRHYVVRGELVEELEKGASALRAAGLVPYLSTELESIALEGADAGWKLERGGWGGRTAGTFLLVADGRKRRASRRALDGWLVHLARLEVDRFVAVPAAREPRAHVLTLTPKRSEEPAARIEIGGACPGGGVLVVRRAPRPAAGCAAEERTSVLLVPPDALVDRHVVGTAESDMVELVFAGDDSAVEIARKETGWHMRKPTDGPVAEDATRALVQELVELEGELLEERPAVEPVQARVRIVALPERGADPNAPERVEQIEVGAPKDGFVHVRRKDDGAVLRLAEEAAVALLPRPSALRAAQIHDVSIHDVRGLKLDCDGKRQHLSREDSGSWKLVEPKSELGADMGLASELAESMRQLSAVRWIGEKRLDAHALDAPWCTIALEVRQDGEERTLTVRLGAETRGGYYAETAEEPAVFVAPRALAVQAQRWLLDRSALRVDPAEVAEVELRSGESETRIVARGDRWTVEGAPSSRTGPQVRAAFEQLVAEQVLHRGAPAGREGLSEPALVVEVSLRAGDEVRTLRVGAADNVDGLPVRFVRRDDLDATFLVAESRLRPLFDAL